MYARRPCGNRDGIARAWTEHVPRGRDELGEDQRRGPWAGGIEVVPRRDQRPPERRGESERREPAIERRETTPVIPGRHRARRQESLRGAEHEPEREQAVSFGAAGRSGEQRDEPLLGGRGGRDHATRRSTAASTVAGAMSPRQRWWPSGHCAVPVAEQGRQSRARCSTRARAR